jgi:hypothetical protein
MPFMIGHMIPFLALIWATSLCLFNLTLYSAVFNISEPNRFAPAYLALLLVAAVLLAWPYVKFLNFDSLQYT